MIKASCLVGVFLMEQDDELTRARPPDTIMNPHGFPSRMTVGKMIELLAGKVCFPFCPSVQWVMGAHIHILLGWCTRRQTPIRHRLWGVQGQSIIPDL